MRNTGIDLVGHCPWGTHFCQFYQTPQDLSEILVPYFKTGLENNEFCMWVTSPPLKEQDAETALRHAVPDLDRYRQNGQLEILPHSDWYLRGGTFDQQRVLKGWLGKLDQALARGFDGLRLTGNTFWLEKSDWKAFAEYEKTVNAVIGKHRMIALCTYSLEKCGGQEILDVVRNHQFALIKSERGWDLLEGSDARRAREVQRESEERYRGLFNAMNEGFALHEILCDEKGLPVDYRFLDVNPAFERLTGLSRADVIGRTVREVLPATEQFWIETYGRVALTGQPVHFERLSARLGKEFEVSAYRSGPGRFATLFFDVSERTRIEQKLTWLASFPELNPNPIVEVDLTKSSIDYLNPAARKLFPDLETIGLRHPWLAGIQAAAEEMCAQKQALWREVSVRGEYYQQTLSLAVARDRMRVYGINVTARRKAQEQVERQAARLRQQTELLDLAHVLAWDLENRIVLWNRGVEELYGWSKEEALGRSSHDLLQTQFPMPLGEIKAELFRKGLWEGELIHIRKDGTRITVASHWVLQRDESGKPATILEVNNDITGRRKAEQRLNLLAETAGELLRSDSPQAVVDALCKKVLSFLDCDAFFNFLVDDVKHCLHLNACGGIPEEEVRRIEWLDYGVAVCGCAARDGKCIVCENIPETPDPRTDLVKSYGIKAYACHPLVSGEKVLGTLSFGTRNRTSFTGDELSLMKAVADQVAIAIERKRAREALRRANEDLERRVAERTSQLQEKSRFLEASFQHSFDCLVFLDKQFNFIRVNEVYARACGRDPAEFPGHNHFEFYPHAENQAIFEEVVRSKTPYQVSAKPFSFPDHPEWGVSYWDWTLNPVLDEKGEVDFLVFSLRDVTRRQHGLERIKEASRYARSLLEASLDPLVTISREGKITDVNEATELATGVNREHLIGSNFSEYFTEPEGANVGYQKVLSEGLVRDYPLTIRHSAGRTTDVLYNATVYRNEAGEPQGVFAAARDVTERKRMEEHLRTVSLYARGLIEASLDPLVTISHDGKITDVNKATELATGVQREHLIGSNFSDYFTEPEKANAGYQKVLSEGLVRDYPLTIRHTSGRTTDVLYNATVYRNEAGEPQGVFAAARDVTEHKRIERVLQESEARYRSLVNATTQIVWTANAQGEVDADIPSWRSFTGQSYEEIRGWGWADAVHPEDREHTSAAWTCSVETRSLYEVEYRIRRHDGVYRRFAVRGVPVLELGGVIREWVGTCTDITDRTEAEKRRNATNALLELFARKDSSTEYLDSVVDVIRDWSDCEALGIRVTDDQSQIPYESSIGFNPGFLEMESCLSLERDQCCCIRAVTQAIEPQDKPLLTPGGSFRLDNSLAFIDRLQPAQRSRYRGTCMKHGYASLAVVPIRDRDQILGAIHLADRRPEHFPLPVMQFIESITPLIGEAMRRFRAEAELGRYRDHLEDLVKQRTIELEAANAQLQTEIGERLRAEDSLRRTAEELERSNRDLEQFAYVSSHDLQEPLRAVAGYVELLRHRYGDKLEDKAHQYISGASDGAARMQKLIVDLLAFSRVGTQGLNLEPADLNSILDAALNSLKVSIQESGAEISSDPLPVLRVDATQIGQLLQNLVGNAIKFRSDAPPRIHVGARKQPGHWLLSVQDNGIGIDPQYAERIFVIFQRLHTRLKYSGTGVGLAICKRIVERHGGRIWVDSQPEKGSTFYFTIPFRDEDLS